MKVQNPFLIRQDDEIPMQLDLYHSRRFGTVVHRTRVPFREFFVGAFLLRQLNIDVYQSTFSYLARE